MKTAIVIGGARCIWEDYKRAAELVTIADTIAVNDIGVHWPATIKAWCSLHGEKLPAWVMARRANCFPVADSMFTGLSAGDDDKVRSFVGNCVEAKFDGQHEGGSSGLFAVKVALVDLNYDRVIICGCPMVPEEVHFDIPDTPWDDAIPSRRGWHQAYPHLKGRAFSMSGWTRALLGEPV